MGEWREERERVEARERGECTTPYPYLHIKSILEETIIFSENIYDQINVRNQPKYYCNFIVILAC